MAGGLTPFWIEFDYSADPLPPVKEIRENVDVSSLDEGHVLRNIGPLHVRGVWFPRGY